eukprot:TRINITY_DN9618_c0_g1::TRINITY_DN9618_c0_g1_i1::g.10144::m.10144 TRINITY_DN9618_c0_g1::TRINITY_DN9618_c0_g1_i1::g.10144  ORF type:complete len:278 (+),score=29.51,NUC202/PF08166.7/10,NUC202/PF08166.7/1.4e+02,NUC202/PF08166.7/15 TRINITY_DN9618_c0_g1_i1:694-1527(+)
MLKNERLMSCTKIDTETRYRSILTTTAGQTQSLLDESIHHPQLLLSVLRQANITPDDQQKDALIFSLLHFISPDSSLVDPHHVLQLLHLIPSDSNITRISDNLEYYVSDIIQYSSLDHKMYPLLCLLNELCRRNTSLLKPTLTSLSSMSLVTNHTIPWDLFQQWCKVLLALCDLPAHFKAEGPGLHNLDHLDVDDINNQHACTLINKPVVLFVIALHNLLNQANNMNDTKLLKLVHGLLWRDDFGSIFSILPVALIFDLTQYFYALSLSHPVEQTLH